VQCSGFQEPRLYNLSKKRQKGKSLIGQSLEQQTQAVNVGSSMLGKGLGVKALQAKIQATSRHGGMGSITWVCPQGDFVPISYPATMGGQNLRIIPSPPRAQAI
jgi:hypothetical protein